MEDEHNEFQKDKSRFLRGDTIPNRRGIAQISSQSGRAASDSNESRFFEGTNRKRVLPEDTEGRKISTQIASKLSNTAVVDELGRPISL